jgi:hydrogenase maturation factor
LLQKNAIRDPRVIIGPGVGLDVAVIDLGDKCLVAKSDPVTFATDAIGWYVVNVNANDIATAGARPIWFLATLLLPERGCTPELVEAIYADLRDACNQLEVDLIGGHTEITIGLDRPIMCGFMLGEVARADLVRADGAQPDDRLLLTKRIAVEGTAIIGLEAAERLGDAAFARCCAGFLREPGISVLCEARAACAAGGVHAMHDPTEGGVAAGIMELGRAAGCGVRIDAESIPYYPETRRACEILGLEPLGVIASGSLLIAAAPESSATIIESIIQDGVECTDIGEITAHGAPYRFITAAGECELPVFERDEIARLLAGSE